MSTPTGDPLLDHIVNAVDRFLEQREAHVDGLLMEALRYVGTLEDWQRYRAEGRLQRVDEADESGTLTGVRSYLFRTVSGRWVPMLQVDDLRRSTVPMGGLSYHVSDVWPEGLPDYAEIYGPGRSATVPKDEAEGGSLGERI